jgi:hypothetical protein
MSKVPTEFELFKLLPPEKREQVLAKLLPGLGDMLGAVYDDYKDEHEATYNDAATAAQKKPGDCE